MSSHHIIKDNQEGTVLLMDKGAVLSDVLGGYLEWSPIIVSGQKVFLHLHNVGVKVDALIATKDFIIENEEEIGNQQPIDLIEPPVKKSELESGISYLISKKANAINIFIDLNFSQFYKLQSLHPYVNINCIYGSKVSYIISNGVFEKWLPAKTEIALIPNVSNQKFIVKGAIDKVDEKPEVEVRYKMSEDGLFKIESNQKFIVTESI